MNITWTNSTSQKGLIFTIDSIFTVLIILIIVFLSFVFVFGKIEKQNYQFDQFFLEEKTIAIADSLVKNSNVNSFLGLAKKDLDKKRVISNFVSLDKINFIDLDLDGFFIKEINLIYKNNLVQNIFSSDIVSDNCFSITRFVLVDDLVLKKAKINVVGCYE